MKRMLLLICTSFILMGCKTEVYSPPLTGISYEQRSCSMRCQEFLVNCSNHRNRMLEQCLINANLQAKNTYNDYVNERMMHRKKPRKTFGYFLAVAMMPCHHKTACQREHLYCINHCGY